MTVFLVFCMSDSSYSPVWLVELGSLSRYRKTELLLCQLTRWFVDNCRGLCIVQLFFVSFHPDIGILRFFYGLKPQILLVKDNRGSFKLKYPRVLSFGYKVKVFSFAGFFTEFIGKGKANTVSQILVENGFIHDKKRKFLTPVSQCMVNSPWRQIVMVLMGVRQLSLSTKNLDTCLRLC